MHVMLDIETWGTMPGSAIRSIAAVAFDPASGAMMVDDTFYRNIEDQSCLDAGLTQDATTIAFWAKQKAEAQEALMQGQVPIAEALADFFSWFLRAEGEQVWAQGAAFDPVLVEAACKATGVRVPWKFWNVRDTRTVYELAEYNYHAVKRVGMEHHALDDCYHQIKLLLAARNKLDGIGEDGFR